MVVLVKVLAGSNMYQVRSMLVRSKDLTGNTSSDSSRILSLHFDGKRDATYVMHDVDGRKRKRKVNEEHITMISEPNSQYVGHFTPTSGSARSIANGIMNFCRSKNISLADLSSIGCDGAAVNT